MKLWTWIIGLALIFAVSNLSAQDDQVPIDVLKNKATAFVKQLQKEEFEEAVKEFDATMSRVMPADKLRTTWEMVNRKAGAFRGIVSTFTQKSGIYDIIFVVSRFEKGTLDIKVVFDPEGKVTGLFFAPHTIQMEYKAPDYADPGSFTEVEVSIGLEDWKLPGTITLPKGSGPHPAVILVHGSGPNDRDESIGPNKPFKDMAWGLASRGIAVLRYEKRTKAYNKRFLDPEGRFTVWEETVEDALLALEFLQGREEVNPHRIFILGHSLGGMMTPRIGHKAQSAAGFILLAGAARPLEDLVIEQYDYIFNLDGSISDGEKKQLDELREVWQRIKDLEPEDINSPIRKALMGAFPEYWLDLRDYSPSTEIRGLAKPLLILQGGRDYQVTEKDYAIWKTALEDRDDVTFRFYPELNHLFIAGEGTITPAEYQKAGHVSLEVIEDIVRWINALSL